jgi:hypothetical protein
MMRTFQSCDGVGVSPAAEVCFALPAALPAALPGKSFELAWLRKLQRRFLRTYPSAAQLPIAFGSL